MRRSAKVDSNQAAIVQALRSVGASVQSLASVGAGCPDLAVGYRGRTHLFEVKTPKGKLTDDQLVWFSNWRGHAVQVIRSADEALRAIGAQTDISPPPTETWKT